MIYNKVSPSKGVGDVCEKTDIIVFFSFPTKFEVCKLKLCYDIQVYLPECEPCLHLHQPAQGFRQVPDPMQHGADLQVGKCLFLWFRDFFGVLFSVKILTRNFIFR